MSPSEPIVRRFRAGDQRAARALILEGMSEHWGSIDEELNPDLDDIESSFAAGVFLVACQGRAIVGTGSLMPDSGETARLARMSVAAGHRRRGLGRRLLEALLDEARSRGFAWIALETEADWHDAVGFYRASGFEPLERRGSRTALSAAAGPAP